MIKYSFRQYKRYLMLERPTELADIVSKEDFAKAQAYNLDKSRFGFFESFYKQFETVLLLHYDALPYIWDVSGNVLFKLFGYDTEYEVMCLQVEKRGLVFNVVYRFFILLYF
jgi:STE24 endopeptidase